MKGNNIYGTGRAELHMVRTKDHRSTPASVHLEGIDGKDGVQCGRQLVSEVSLKYDGNPGENAVREQI